MKKNSLFAKHRILFAAVLVVLGVVFRTILHFGDNVEFVTAGSLLAGSYLGFFYAFSVPLVIMMASDFFLGNTNIFIFTWSAYVVVGIAGYFLQKFQISNFKFQIVRAAGLGVIASLWFYIWTNFGVWILDSWGMYPKTLSGLIDAYILGLPFLKLNIIGNLVFVPSSFTIVELVNAIRKEGVRQKSKSFKIHQDAFS